MLWALGVAAEIVLFAISGRLQVAPTTMLLVGAAGAFVRWSAMALDPCPELLPALQCLHGLSFGATHLGTVGFIVRATPPRVGRDRPGCLAVALSTVTAAAMGLSGLLYASWGALAYGAMALMAGVGGLSALAVHRMARRVQETASLPGDDQRQVGYIVASSRPLRYIMRRERPPRRVIQLRTCSG